MLAFREVEPVKWLPVPRVRNRGFEGDESAPRSDMPREESKSNELAPRAQAMAPESSNPGTGWGSHEHDRVERTQFRAERNAVDRIVLRYEYESRSARPGIFHAARGRTNVTTALLDSPSRRAGKPSEAKRRRRGPSPAPHAFSVVGFSSAGATGRLPWSVDQDGGARCVRSLHRKRTHGRPPGPARRRRERHRDGKLNILGVFNALGAATFPATHLRCTRSCASKRRAPKSGKTKQIEIHLADSDGNKLFTVATTLVVPQGTPGSPIRLNHILALNGIRFDRAGDYVFNVLIGDDPQGRHRSQAGRGQARATRGARVISAASTSAWGSHVAARARRGSPARPRASRRRRA